MKLIINADDFGKDTHTTHAILEAFSKKYCSSTTIMANGDAFDEAIEIAKNNHIIDKVGIHLNLTEGKPLTNAIRSLKNFCDEEGMFNTYFMRKTIRPTGFSRDEKTAVSIEIRAQIAKCIKADINISHADSHHHIHTRWEVWQVIEPILKDVGISKIRISRNCGVPIPSVKRIYKLIYNNNLSWRGFKTTKYFGSIADVGYLISNNPGIINCDDLVEIMIHPVYKNTNKLFDLDNRSLSLVIRTIQGWENAIAYSECL